MDDIDVGLVVVKGAKCIRDQVQIPRYEEPYILWIATETYLTYNVHKARIDYSARHSRSEKVRTECCVLITE
jgi:hypothetical protein